MADALRTFSWPSSATDSLVYHFPRIRPIWLTRSRKLFSESGRLIISSTE
jgi:hypothetical protein